MTAGQPLLPVLGEVSDIEFLNDGCCCSAQNSSPRYFTGTTTGQPLLPVAGEVFALRKLLPQTADYDFNVHVMDFQPGEFLNAKVDLCCGFGKNTVDAGHAALLPAGLLPVVQCAQLAMQSGA